MTYGKAFGLALIAAVSLTAVTVDIAAATKVCSHSGAGASCAGASGNVYNGELHSLPEKHLLEGGGNFVLSSSFITVTCDSTLSGSITNGETGTGAVTALTLTNCTSKQATNCSGSSTASGKNQWHFVIWSTFGSTTVKNPGLQWTCTVFGIATTCIYADSSVGEAGEVDFTAGGSPWMDWEFVSLTRQAGSGFGCSETGTMFAEYQFTTPGTLFFQ